MNNHLYIRISDISLSMTVTTPQQPQQPVFQPYVVRSGISMAANLREAFKENSLLQQDYAKVDVLIDSDVLTIPMEEYDEQQAPALYQHAFPEEQGNKILANAVPGLNMAGVFPINKDLLMVIHDHFSEVRIQPVVQCVVEYMFHRSFIGQHRKLYVYFHDERMHVFAFEKNRLKFFNAFNTDNARDAIYFMLYVWKQLDLNPLNDELLISGTIPEREWMDKVLRKYVRSVYCINPAAEFNRAPITRIANLPFDIMTLLINR